MSWVGGDIPGLQQMGHTLQRAPQLIEPVVRSLTDGVDKLGDDAQWSGDAAEAFRHLWTSDAVRAGGIGTIAGRGGEIIGGLGDRLAELESALYNAAHEASSRGAQIAPDGRPLPLVITGDPTTPEAQQAMSAQNDYQAAYAETMQLARGFRLDAASDLAGLVEPIVDDEGAEKLKPEEWTTIGDYLKAFYVVPNDRNARIGKALPGEIQRSREEFRGLRKELKAAKADFASRGLSIPKDNPARVAHLSASKELDAMTEKLAGAEAGRGELPMSTLLNTKIGDIENKPQRDHEIMTNS